MKVPELYYFAWQELLALGEQIGSVGTGLSVEFVRNHLKLRTFSSSTSCINLEEVASLDQQINFCVICQVYILAPYLALLDLQLIYYFFETVINTNAYG